MEEKHWFITSAIYIAVVLIAYPVLDVFKLDPNEIGDYLAGLLTPLALLWLVLGYCQQGKELKQNTEQIKLQVEELRQSVEAQIRQAKSVEANTCHVERDVFFGLAEQLINRLEVLAVRVFAETRNSKYTDLVQKNFSQGMLYEISNRWIHKDLTNNRVDSYQGQPIRQALHQYIRTYELLMKEIKVLNYPKEILPYYEDFYGEFYNAAQAVISGTN